MARTGKSPLQSDMVQGTLDLLILQTLSAAPAHGHTIAYSIERRSEDVLQVEHGSPYPALHRLEDRAGSLRSGARRKTIAAPAIIG